MSHIYDNWERLVAATLKRVQLRELCHQPSRTPSICSEASDFDSSFRLDPEVPFGISTSASSSKYQQLPEFERVAFGYSSVRDVMWDFLGKGRLGSTYKAVLIRGEINVAAVVILVKKLELISTSEKDFKQRMQVFEKVRHENVCALRGYSYLEKEKQALVWYDYYNNGSVSSMLHGIRTGKILEPLDWKSRLKIAVGAARGLCYIHKKKLVHGNIESSSIFLNELHYGCVSEMGLATLDGYCAPEVIVTKKVTQDSDVYGFGVLLLELLTGMSPKDKIGFNKVTFVRWALCLISEEGFNYFLFDLVPAMQVGAPVLASPQQVQTREDILKILELSVSCVSEKPKLRPSMDVVLKVVERVHKGLRLIF